MDISVLSSTFLLTLLLLVGLLFFIRASVKERTQVVKLLAEQTQESILEQLQQYFSQRSYRIALVDSEQQEVTFEGFVRPSLFLAIFLTGLAAIGGLCLALVLSILLPQITVVWFALVLLAPLAGVFYWRQAGRPEKVLLRVESWEGTTNLSQSVITITAHRDELAALQQSLSLKPIE